MKIAAKTATSGTIGATEACAALSALAYSAGAQAPTRAPQRV